MGTVWKKYTPFYSNPLKYLKYQKTGSMFLKLKIHYCHYDGKNGSHNVVALNF